MNNDIVTLRLGGIDWHGWTSCEITRQIDAAAGGFALSLTDRWSWGNERLAVYPGLECQILIGKDQVIDGYINSLSQSLSASGSSLSLQGRDRSGDMVDCAAEHDGGCFFDLNLFEIAKKLGEAFGVKMSFDVPLNEIFKIFKIEPGETAFSALDRALRQRGLLALPDKSGGIRITEPGSSRAVIAIEEGKNLLSATLSYSESERFSKYTVLGQHSGGDDDFGEAAASVEAVSYDGGIRRYRPFVVRAENQVNSGSAKKRADWEKTVRAARSAGIEAELQGFRQTEGGPLWEPGIIAQVKIPDMRIEQDMLISQVVFSMSESGSVTKLSLKDPDAFRPEPLSPDGGKFENDIWED